MKKLPKRTWTQIGSAQIGWQASTPTMDHGNHAFRTRSNALSLDACRSKRSRTLEDAQTITFAMPESRRRRKYYFRRTGCALPFWAICLWRQIGSPRTGFQAYMPQSGSWQPCVFNNYACSLDERRSKCVFELMSCALARRSSIQMHFPYA